MLEHNTYAQRFSLGSQNRDYQLDFSLFSFQCYNTYLYMPKHPIPWTENHRVQNHGPKTIASKNKNFQGAVPDPIKWCYGYPSNPLLTMWKEYDTTQHQC